LSSSRTSRPRLARSLFASLLLFPAAAALAQGGSAVITLVMPVGARQLGMGETAVAVADDVFGTFWNPAGMAFGPLSNEWELVLPKAYRRSGVEMRRDFTVLATKPRSGFLLRSTVWAGARDGLLLYNGRVWKADHEYVLEQGDQIDKIVRRYAGTGDRLDSLVQRVKLYNRIKTAQDEEDLISLRLPYNLLFPDEAVTALALDNTDRLWVGTTGGLYRFDGSGWKAFDKEPGFTYLGSDTASVKGADASSPEVAAKLAALDTAGFRKLADSLAAGRKSAALGPDTSKSKVDSIQARDQAKAQRAADSLNQGAVARSLYDSLYREAKQEILDEATARADSLASKAKGDSASAFRKLGVTSLVVKGSSIWIGTTDGLYEYKKTSITRRGQNLLPSQYVTGIAAHENLDEIYVSLKDAGIARYTPAKSAGAAAKWKLFGVADGLVDSSAHQILLDKDGHVWAAHAHGISHYTALRVWEKIHFRKQVLRSLALDEDGHIWIATNEGAWKYTPRHTNAKGRLEQKKEAGGAPKKDELRSDWVHFHTGNGLADKDVFDVKAQGPDVWFVTGAGIERYNSAKSQVGFFYESLLPVLNLPDLYHAFMAATFPVEEWGTVGGFINYVSFGKNTQTNAAGDNERTFDSYELVGALSYGTRLAKDVGLGLNAKFIYSALAQGVTSSGERTDGIAISYAVDAGLLWKNVLVKGLSAALVLQNMGPAVFYVDQAQADPIPFTWKVGLAYELLHLPNHRVTVAADANREAVYREGNEASPVYIGAWKDLVYPYEDKDHSSTSVLRENFRQTVYNTGIEYVIANVVGLRAGYLYDLRGQRYELDMGAGFMISDILQVDGTFIKSFDNGIRNNQKRFSMLLRF
jgi:ligand-binding sensor domain-containing protein